MLLKLRKYSRNYFLRRDGALSILNNVNLLSGRSSYIDTSLMCIIIYIATYCIRCWDLGGYFISHRVKYACYFDTGIINRVVFYFETRKSRSIVFFFFLVHVSSERKTDGQFNPRKSAAPREDFHYEADL